MLMLQLLKSLEIFLVYLMHNPQALRGIPVTVNCDEHSGFLVLEKDFFCSYCSIQKQLQNLIQFSHRKESGRDVR